MEGGVKELPADNMTGSPQDRLRPGMRSPIAVLSWGWASEELGGREIIHFSLSFQALNHIKAIMGGRGAGEMKSRSRML